MRVTDGLVEDLLVFFVDHALFGDVVDHLVEVVFADPDVVDILYDGLCGQRSESGHQECDRINDIGQSVQHGRISDGHFLIEDLSEGFRDDLSETYLDDQNDH